jgi:mono/diheme cytochrome c family protein
MTYATAHPLQAEPINHPYVFTFDQFFVAEDPDEHLVNGGLLLMAELRCGACHELPAAWRQRLAPVLSPDLSAVGSRLGEDNLWLMTRSPQHRKRGTQMPALMHGNVESRDENVEALVSFLASLKQADAPLPAGDPVRGKLLYHAVGCVACHEPAADVRPSSIPADQTFDRPGNGSVPIALADTYDLSALARFLLEPRKNRPSGRMPQQRLTEQEAADIAAYLHEGRKVETAPERALLAVPKQSIETGRIQFSEQRCANCHSMPGITARPALPLAKLVLDTATNCLTESPQAGAAKFDFNALQLRALRLAVKHVQTSVPEVLDDAQEADWLMTRMNCYACHDRDGKGGPEEPRAAYFSLHEPFLLPPNLDNVGGKLLPDALKQALLKGAPSVRPGLTVRMPLFAQQDTEALLECLLTEQPAKPMALDGDPARGEAAIGAKGLNCVQCHDFKGIKATSLSAVDLSTLTQRVTPSYFQASLKGEVMLPLHPPVMEGVKDAESLIKDIWSYLKERENTLPQRGKEAEDAENGR